MRAELFLRLVSFAMVLLGLAVAATQAHAGGLACLQEFVKTVNSGQADFTQVVTSPAKNQQPPRVKTSSGTFEFSRPNRFSFRYTKPFVQSIVADGHTLWLYDQDLNQVTARQQAALLGSTPVALIAAAPDLHALQAHFTLLDAPGNDALQWVLATPKAKDDALQSVRIGLAAPANSAPCVTLGALEIVDSFGQRSVLSFSHFQLNPALPASRFEFKPPLGADLIRQ